MRKSNQERAKEIADLIRSFIKDRDTYSDSNDWIQKSGPKAGKGIKRKELAEILGISLSTLRENEAAQDLIEAENRWCASFHAEQANSKAKSNELDRARQAEKTAKRKLSALDTDNDALKAENRLLRQKLSKYESVDQLLMETGRMPRLFRQRDESH